MTTTSAAPADAYQEFAGVYDAFTAGSDYDAWTAHVLELAEGHGCRGSTVLDVACGTGKSFLPFVRRGFDVTACDSSRAMLAEAERKSPGVRLIEADMRRLPRLGRFDLVTCFDDSLNHLLDEADLVSAVVAMAGNLAPNGLLLFDLNTLLAYRTTFAADSVSAHDGLIFACRGEASPDAPPGCLAAVRIDVFAPRDDGLYRRSSARLAERHFPPHRVLGALAAAGLRCLGAHGVLDDGSIVPEVDETRQLKTLYVAKVRKGGDSE